LYPRKELFNFSPKSKWETKSNLQSLLDGGSAEFSGLKKSSKVQKEIKRTFNFSRCQEDIKKVLKLFRSDPEMKLLKSIPVLNDRNLAREILIFSTKLDLYDKKIEKKIYCGAEIFSLCLEQGPAFTEFLSKTRKTSYIFHNSTNHFSLNEDCITDEYLGYDGLFPYQHLIHWEEENFDLAYGFLPDFVQEADVKKFSDEFKQMIKKYLPFGFERSLEETDMSKEFSTSTCFSLGSRFSPLQSESLIQNFEELDGVLADACVVQVSPDNSRFGIRPSAEQLPIIRKFSFFINQIADKFPHSAMRLNQDDSGKTIKSFQKKNHFYYMLDIRKCGITLSKKLQKAMIDILVELFPDLQEIWDYGIRLLDSRIATEGGSVQTETGFNIGWVNGYPTIIQSVIFNLFKKEFEDLKLKAMFFNDDSVIGEKMPKELLYSRRNPENDLTRLARSTYQGIVLSSLIKFFSKFLFLNIKKTFSSENRWVFCEIYFDCENKNFTYKDSLDLLCLIDAMACTNIVQAKANVCNALTVIGPDMLRENKLLALKTLQKFWGYEFSKNELSWPYKCGGWIHPTSLSLDQSFAIAKDSPDIRLLQLFIALSKCHLNLGKPKLRVIDVKKHKTLFLQKYSNNDFWAELRIRDTPHFKKAKEELDASQKFSNDFIDASACLPESLLLRKETLQAALRARERTSWFPT